MTVTDAIERELILDAARAEVWAAITTPEGLQSWWSDHVDIDLRAGGPLVFHSPYGIHHATVVAIEPQRRFAFTWRPFQSDPDAGQAGDLTTEVEFRLDDHPQGTRLVLIERGFSTLPGALGERTLRENTQGWDIEVLPRLKALVESTTVGR